MILKKIGFSVNELIYFDVGDIFNIAFEYLKALEEEAGPQTATQEDIDAF